ncbi:MAG TPA: twin-arginine translocase subunit TatC [Egibacteraceae bacterium]|nr:twin-arginine translocase subunit TatC [Actinomycetota bacterium]HWB71579.1 twin-arginine translocase subunit TatC [Egibacteraceae bacterium]
MTATASPPDAGGAAVGEGYSGQEMALVEHLDELRQRLFKAAVAIVLGFSVGFVFRNQVLELLRTPYCQLPPELRAGELGLDQGRCTLVFMDVLGGFFLSLKAAAMVAVVLAAPAVCYQIWRFVTPGLRPVEKRYALPFVVLSQLLFAGGAVFSYFLIPRALHFLLGFAGPGVVSLMDANRYLTFVLQTMIAFGIAFEFPLVLMILSLMGVVSSAGMRRYRRQALFGTFVAAAIITPTQDPLTMSFMAAPLVIFYEGSILFARVVERRRGAEAVAAS